MLALAGATAASGAPNVANASQKGSLLLFSDIRVDGQGGGNPINTLIRIQNDGSQDVDLKCYWMDGNKNRVDFIVPITRNQAIWFDARTGTGTYQVNQFPNTAANGFDNPYLPGFGGPYQEGLLVCWAVDNGGQNQVKWNHLSGTATVWGATVSLYTYNAYAFFVPTGLDLEPVGVAGILNLNGIEYDSCPQYQIAQFTPIGAPALPNRPTLIPGFTRLAIAGCTLDLRQDWLPIWTKLQFDVWNEEEVKFTGAFECADSWHEIDNSLDAAAQNFVFDNLGTYAARVRVQGVASTQCPFSQPVGILAVQSGLYIQPLFDSGGTTLANAGKFTGRITWDPSGSVPEGAIR
jgi:hypothetical protein